MIRQIAVNEDGVMGIVTGKEMKDMEERSIDVGGMGDGKGSPYGPLRHLAAGPMRVAWTGIKFPGGGPWRGVNVRAATKEELAGLV